MAKKYMRPDRIIEGDKLVGIIQYNHVSDVCDIVIDGEPYTWKELGESVSIFEGFKIKIEFYDVDDDLD